MSRPPHRGPKRNDRWTSLQTLIQDTHVVVEVVDARDVEKTRLRLAEKWATPKKLFLVANKTDLRDRTRPLPILPFPGLYFSVRLADEIDRRRLMSAIRARVSTRPLRVLLVGYPNVGKSSLINLLARRRAAKVSVLAGTTKNVQWVRVAPDMVVSDYRGMFPKKEPREELVRKGALHATGDEERYAHPLAERMLKKPALRQWLEKKYDIDLVAVTNSEQLLEAIARRRGWYLKGRQPNLNEAARSLLRTVHEAPEI